ncbi:MAG: tetratricopeptide repeat protein [Parachlamydiaceae bacterium]
MTKSSRDYQKIFKEIAHSRKWEKLDEFGHSVKIDTMSPNDKVTLANLFYEKGKQHALDKQNEKSLREALDAFETSLKIDPSNGKRWTEKAHLIVELAFLQNDFALFEDANEMFSHAQKVFTSQSQLMPVIDLYKWGVCCYQIGKFSEEPLDFKGAIEKFREAFERGYDTVEFFFDYATALAELGSAIGRIEFILESFEYLQKCLSDEAVGSKAWLKLACVCKLLYVITSDPEYYTLADQGFFEAARCASTDLSLWINWGQLLVHEGKLTRDPELIASSLEKFEKADALHPNDPAVLGSWGDSLMHLGAIEDRLELLKEAKEKIEAARAIAPDDLELLCLNAHYLIQLGRYFFDERYILQAIEKFEVGLGKDRTLSTFWHGLATANFILGEIHQDHVYFERAAKNCSEAIHHGGGENPQFWNDWGLSSLRVGELTNDLRHMITAVEKFEKAIALVNKKKAPLSEPEWYYNYGCALDYLGDFYSNPQYYEKAIQIFARLIEQHPHLKHVRYNLALAFYHLGDATGDVESLERSIEHFKTLFQGDYEDEVLCNDMGITYLTLADLLMDSILPQKSEEYFEKAEQFFLQAVSLGNLIANYHLACLHSLKENHSEAMFYIVRAKDADVLPSVSDLLRDDWLEGLRSTTGFQDFLSQLSSHED